MNNLVYAVSIAALVAIVAADDHAYSMCQGVRPGLWVRDPQDCMVAHHCAHDLTVSQSVRCNASQVWSKLASACVWEWDPDRDDCNGSPQQPIPNDPRCAVKTGNNPDPDDCSRFLSCANGTLLAVQRCGDGTLYWPRNNTCEFAAAVMHDCGSRRVPDTIVVPEDDPLCYGRDGAVADPGSCRHFIMCEHGKRKQRIQCAHGTAFSEAKKDCQWGTMVNCHDRA